MELIELFVQYHKCDQVLKNYSLIIGQNNQLSNLFFYKNQNQYSFFHLYSYLQLPILQKFKYNLTQKSILSQYTFFNTHHIPNSKLLKSLFIRKFLHRNLHSPYFKFIFHPKNAHPYIQIFYIQLYPHQNLFQILQEYYLFILNIQQKIFQQLNHILLDIGIQTQQQEYLKIQHQLNSHNSLTNILGNMIQLKKYIAQSQYFGCNIQNYQKKFNQNKKFSNQLFNQKKQNSHNKNLIKFSLISKNLSSVFSKLNQIDDIVMVKEQQMNIINARYLQRFPVERIVTPFVLYINANNEFIQIIKLKEQFKITSGQNSLILRIHKYNEEQREHLIYQNQVLKKLSNVQFPGLAKYYFTKNYQKQTELYKFTNLSDFIELDKYLQNNRQIISFQSKINILIQIVLILRYLRDSNVTYLNLIPKNIIIKKCHVKLFNFTNSYHPKLNHLKIKKEHKLPYVLINHSQNYFQQKSDVFSYGCILYKIIFQKDPLNLKQSIFKQLSFQKFLQKLKYMKIVMQNTKIHKLDVIKLFLYLALKCYSYQYIENMKQIPYLDWVVISLKYVQNLIISRNLG